MAADAEKEAKMTTKLTKALNGWKTKESEQAYKLGVLGGKKKKWKSQESEQAFKLGVTAAKKNKYKGDDAELESKNAQLKGEMKQLEQKTDGEMAADAEKETKMITKLTKALNGWK